MGQQIAIGNTARRRGGLVFDARAADIDVALLELGQHLGNRVVKLEAAFLVQHHDGNRRQRLSHRVDPDDGIGVHRGAAGDVGLADRLEVGDLATPHDGSRTSRQLAAIDHAGEPVIDAGETVWGQAHGFRGGGDGDAHGLVSSGGFA